jgi:hypothetical protein
MSIRKEEGNDENGFTIFQTFEIGWGRGQWISNFDLAKVAQHQFSEIKSS